MGGCCQETLYGSPLQACPNECAIDLGRRASNFRIHPENLLNAFAEFGHRTSLAHGVAVKHPLCGPRFDGITVTVETSPRLLLCQLRSIDEWPMLVEKEEVAIAVTFESATATTKVELVFFRRPFCLRPWLACPECGTTRLRQPESSSSTSSPPSRNSSATHCASELSPASRQHNGAALVWVVRDR